MITDNALPSRTIKTPYVDALDVAIPYHLIVQIRTHQMNTTDEIVFAAMDSIGIESIMDIISQGAFITDIAESLDIPVTKIDKWLRADPSRIEGVEVAERYAAESHLSLAMRTLLNVKPTDTDAMKVAKIKADMLKWMASRKDREKYGEKVSHNHSGSVGVEFHITMTQANGVNQTKVIDI